MQRDKKRIHKKVVSFMRESNRYIQSDVFLGLNRFQIDLWSENYYRYSDGSGYRVQLVFKLSDKLTGNSAYFITDNYAYKREILMYENDFLIRCSAGMPGHFPNLSYVAYDVHEIIPYAGEKERIPKEESLGTYSYISSIPLTCE